jgi:glycopeptide antibiotics resistance protein
MPLYVRNWCNEYYNFRTAVPFIFIGFILEFKSFNNNYSVTQKLKHFFKNILFSIFLVIIAEIGQFFIVHRSPDLMDVFYGFFGSVLGAFVFYLFIFFTVLASPNSKSKK